jgi:hypothetical protein
VVRVDRPSRARGQRRRCRATPVPSPSVALEERPVVRRLLARRSGGTAGRNDMRRFSPHQLGVTRLRREQKAPAGAPANPHG